MLLGGVRGVGCAPSSQPGLALCLGGVCGIAQGSILLAAGLLLLRRLVRGLDTQHGRWGFPSYGVPEGECEGAELVHAVRARAQPGEGSAALTQPRREAAP